MVTIYAGQQEGLFVEEGECILRSGGLGPCIALGAYNTSTKVGYMIHSVDLSLELNQLDLEFKENNVNLSDLVLSVYGSSCLNCPSEENEDSLVKSRDKVTDWLKKHFSEGQYKIEWLEHHRCGELILYLPEGNFEKRLC